MTTYIPSILYSPQQRLNNNTIINFFMVKTIDLFRLIKSYVIDISIISKYNPSSINELLDFSFKYKNTIPSLQVREEIKELLSILIKRDLNAILEIGTARGGTLFLLSRIASKNATIVTVDFPGGGGSIAAYNRFNSFRTHLIKQLVYQSQTLFLLRSDSHTQETLNKITKLKKTFDLLFIDGDHTYEGVKKDFEMYSSLVKHEGLIVFHDISGPEEKDVPKLWNEIKNKYKHLEITYLKNEGYGIGILFV